MRGFLWRYALQSVGLILLLAVLIRTFLVASYVMSGTSMLPNIWPGDFLIGTKWGLSDLHRGDVVVLRCPNGKERICLRRVVGLPGDRVEFKGGRLVLNGTPARVKVISGEVSLESVEGTSWAVWPTGTLAAKEPLIVPPLTIYVLNDKRSDGEDGRRWGPVPSELLEAKAARIWLSLDWFERNGESRAWPRLRWARVFRRVD